MLRRRSGSNASSISSLTSNSGSDAQEEKSDTVSVLSRRMRVNMRSLSEMNDAGYTTLGGRGRRRGHDCFHSSPLPVNTRSPSFLLVANESKASKADNFGTVMPAMPATIFGHDPPSRIHETQIEIEVRDYQQLHMLELLSKRRPPSRNAPVDCVQFHASDFEGNVEADADELSDIS